MSDAFSLAYGPAAKDGPEIELGHDAVTFEPINEDAIDIGEAVAQELSLALPEFPRDPDAVIDAALTEGSAAGPFAALAPLSKPREC